MEKRAVVVRSEFRLVATRRPRILLVDGDLGRRATLDAALGLRYALHAVGSGAEAQRNAALTVFDVAVLDSAVLGPMLPRLARLLRKRGPAVRLVVVAGRRDLRGRHYAATLGVDGRLGRRAPAHAFLDHIGALMVADRPAPFDRNVGRAIDLMAGDVIHLLDVNALAEATGLPLSVLADRFVVTTGLTLDEYVMRVKITVAQHLLRDTDLSMATLAELLGFSDADHLARAAAPTRREV